ncbi:ABC transporter permease [Pseudomonas sp. F1_0610]|uniref:ABC transporter permease n=1 Tax=Pseudomonas sp. F1_0610 TaxID=3114284 RepID=UPI0039C43DDD
MGRLKAIWRCFDRSCTLEAQEAFKDPAIHWLCWIFPLILFVIIGANFSEGTMLDLPVAVVDADKSELSRQLIRDLEAGSHAQIVPYADLEISLKRLRSAEDYAVLYIPHRFQQDVLAGKRPSVQMYYNALFYGAGLYSTQDFQTLITQLNAQYRALLVPMLQSESPMPPLAKITVNYDSLFNAGGNFIYYQQFTAIIHLLQLFVVTCMIYVLDKRKSLLRARPFGVAVIGKLAPYTFVFSTLLLAQIAIMVFVFDAKVAGNPLYMLPVSFFYVIAAQCIGVLLFTFTPNNITAYSLVGICVSIAMSFSGMTVPELSMPLFARMIAELQPLTHALNAMFDIFLRNVTGSSIAAVCAVLMIYPTVTWFLVRKRLLKRYHLEGVL